MLAILDNIGRSMRRSVTFGPMPMSQAILSDWWPGRNADNSSGVSVTRESALSLSTFWKGVNVITNGCSKAGLHRYERIGEHGKRKDRANPIYQLVRSRPNEYMDAFIFWRTIILHGLVEGNGYAAIERNNAGTPTALLLLDPTRTYPVRYKKELWYVTSFDTDGASVEVRLKPGDVFHLKGLGYDGLVGYSPLYILASTIGGVIATRDSATRFYKSGSQLSGVLEAPAIVDQTVLENLQKRWEQLHTGVQNAHRIAILTQGMKFNAMSVNARDAQMLEARQFDRVEIANILGLPPHKLGDLTRQGYNSLEAEEKSVAADAFDPWWTAIEHEADTKLRTPREQKDDSHYYRWNRRAALQTDAKAESETLEIQKRAGFITVDEGRGVLDRGELPFGYGNVIERPAANSTIIDLNNPPKEDDNGDLEFLREYAKILASDGTLSGVIFNMTDAQELLDAVNIPLFKGYQEPWLPVIAENGEMVSGDVVEDSEGDIVGGDTIEDEPAPMPDSTGNGDMNSPDDGSEDQNSPPIRLKRLLSDAQNAKKVAITAIIPVMEDGLRRMVERVCSRGYRPRASENFVDYIDGMELTEGDAFDTAIRPSFTMIRAFKGTIPPVKKQFFNAMRANLLKACECKPSELTDKVKAVEARAKLRCKLLATISVIMAFRDRMQIRPGNLGGETRPDR